MTQYIIIGLVLGGIYSLAAIGLVTTYAASGILDFSYGAVAYFIARFYYFLHTQHHLSIAVSGVLAILVGGPALGAFIWFLLVRRLMERPTVVKVVATVGVFVSLPAAATLIFKNVAITSAPGLAPQPVKVFHPAGVPITVDQLIVFASVILILGVGAAILRYTGLGLLVRASVDSRVMTSLTGSNPSLVTLVVWMFSSFLAGLVGVLVAPIVGLDQGQFTLLVVVAFAAVIAARLKSLPRALAGAMGLGLIEGIAEKFLPSSGYLATAVIPSIPFGVMMIFLITYIVRGSRAEREDHYLVTSVARVPVVTAPSAAGPSGLGGLVSQRLLAPAVRLPGAAAVAVVVLLLPLVLGGQWRMLVGEGMALGVVYLSYTLITGEASLISLCQISFAGVGAVITADLATRHHLPVLLAMVLGGLAAVPFGLIVGLLSVRLGELYVALVTLSVGLLLDNMFFSLSTFSNFGTGISLGKPSFASGDRGFDYLGIAIFALIAYGLARLRRSTAGLALAGIRSSETATRMLGVRTVSVKIAAVGAAAFIAGVGGALFASYSMAAPTTDFNTLQGLIWLSVIVSLGLRSSLAAALAGLTFAFIPALFVTYIPSFLSPLPQILFGLGAIGVAEFPEGAVLHQAVMIRKAIAGMRGGGSNRADGGLPQPADRTPALVGAGSEAGEP